MNGVHRAAVLAGALAFFGGAFAPAAFDMAEAADRIIRECEADGPGDISMQARFERRDGRRKFSVEFEAAPGGAFRDGQRIVFIVDGENVGTRRLETVLGGDLVADLNFDTQGANDPDEDPFPPNFPAVQRGTKVRVKAGGEAILGCTLR